MASSFRYLPSLEDDSARTQEHLKLLDQLDRLPLNEICCELCHCDCYNSHRSSDLSVTGERCRLDWPRINQSEQNESVASDFKFENIDYFTKSLRSTNLDEKVTTTKERKVKKVKRRKSIKDSPSPEAASAECASNKQPSAKNTSAVKQSHSVKARPKVGVKRSKSASSIRSNSSQKRDHQQQEQQIATTTRNRNARDCKILDDLFTSLQDIPANLETGKDQKECHSLQDKEKVMKKGAMHNTATIRNRTKTLPPWPSLPTNLQFATDSQLKQTNAKNTGAPIKLCQSMANLCLEPIVRQAFQQVPAHDKKILNRMATKRSEQVMAKENAWLAQKYWENERYERELLKYEQMEEYKRAIRDKHFQDYLMTKARLNDLARRDLAELERLRASLREKDQRTRNRLESLRVEKNVMLCQRRCDELRKSEVVNHHQEAHDRIEAIRKRDICQRLDERLQRADKVRNQLLEGYLKRLRYDNYVEQLLHEEKFVESQRQEEMKNAQLKEHIRKKCQKTKCFAEHRQKRHEAITKTAKISASLRELVRNSVTPEAALMEGQLNAVATLPINFERLLNQGYHSKR